jgi:hypothetical protein
MLQVFHLVSKVDLDVAYVCYGFQVFSDIFTSVSNVCCKCFSYFGLMLQVFHLNIKKVNLVLHVTMGTHLL